MAVKKKGKVTAYNRLQKAGSALCDGRKGATKRFAKAAIAYKKKAAKSGKSSAQISATVSRLKKCKR